MIEGGYRHENQFLLHSDPDGFWAECAELGGCYTQGESIEDLRRNCSEALSLYLDAPGNEAIINRPDNTLAGNDEYLSILVNPAIAIDVPSRQK